MKRSRVVMKKEAKPGRNTDKVLKALSKRPVDTAMLVKATHMPVDKVRNALASLGRSGAIESPERGQYRRS